MLKGAPNSSINITYNRNGKIADTNVKLGAIEIKAVPFYKLINGDTGYIVLSQFNQNASVETAKALKELKDKGAKKVILDLRGNPGGLLGEAINVANIFIPEGELITSTKSAVEKYNQTFYTTRKPIDTEIPVVVLINSRSASASEIVAGSLQDLDRAVIIGARSFGKGLVQRPKDLTYGTQLKITISRYYTPSGRCIQALDYRDRDREGNAKRITKEDYNEFKTRKGRIVYDGGGIAPDIALETSRYSNVTLEILQQNAIFDYATKYYYNHQVSSPETFQLSDKDYSEFKDFLKSTDFEYETFTEKQLEELKKAAAYEEFDEEISEKYKEIEKIIDAEKVEALDEQKTEILSLLSDEIIKRYFYKEGLYEYYTKNNPEIVAALEVLNNQEKYKTILN